MSELPLPNVASILLAASPILVVLYLMIGRRWGGSKAGPAAWLVAVIVGILFFGANLPLLLVATGRAVLLSLFVLYIIWMALLLYHVVNEAGVIQAIGKQLPGIAGDKPAQALLLAWIFGGFLQGATGFGVPAAVVAPLLVGMGFVAETAVAAALIGHAWAVTFGSLGSSFLSLIAATGLPGEQLASPSALLLGFCCLGCGLMVLWFVDRQRALRQRGLFVLLLALVMGGIQWVVAVAGLWTLAAFAGGFAGLIVAVGYFTFGSRSVAGQGGLDARGLLQAFFPYLILIAIVVLGQLVFDDVLDAVMLNPVFPQVCTTYGVCTPEGTGRSINVFGHGGALLLYASLITFVWYKWRGPLPTAGSADYSGHVIARKTIKGSVKATIGIFTLIAMALTMELTGMTQLLAEVLSTNTGPIFPFLSPFIGALGAFMTGSNTNSNVVFGQLQQQTALALGLAVPIILAGQTAGGAVGSSFAPAKVIVGCSTVPDADEGRVLRAATLAGLVIITGVGLLVLLFA